MGWARLGQAVAADSSSKSVNVGTIDVRMFNHIIMDSGYESYQNNKASFRCGSGGSIDTGNHYSTRVTHNGAGDTQENDHDCLDSGYDGSEQMVIMDCCNRDVNDKLFIWKTVSCYARGTLAQHAPDWKFGTGKWTEDDSGSAPYNTASFDTVEYYADNRTAYLNSSINIFGSGEF